MESQQKTEKPQCPHCGDGFAPDQRINFGEFSFMEIINAAYDHITQARLQMSTAECCLAKAREMANTLSETKLDP